MKKALYVIIAILVVALIVVGIWQLSKRRSAELNKPNRAKNVEELAGEKEKTIGTIIYDGAKLQGEIKKEGQDEIAKLETTDSLEGATNIYYDDLLNRYKNYDVSKKSIQKDDALNKKANVIVCSGKTGKITITLWGDTKGMTQIQIVKTSDFR